MANAWKWYVAIVVAVVVAQRFSAGSLQAAFSIVLMVALIAATVVGVRIHKPADRVFWRLVLANQVLFLAGNVAVFIAQDVMGNYAFPGPGDLFFAPTYLALIVAMSRIVRARSGGKADRAAALDALVIAAGVTIVGWKFWIGASVAGSMPLAARVATIGYPALDIVLFALAVRCLAGTGKRTFSLKLFCATLLLLFLGDGVYGWQLSRGLYTPHNWIDVLWGGCSVFAGAMALHPSMTRMTEVSERKLSFTRARLGLMAVAAALAPAMLALNGLGDRDFTEIVIAVCAVAMFGSVLARAYLASRDDARANAALQIKQDELASTLDVLRATEQQRAFLFAGAIRAGEQERMWVAAELHDGPIQQLAALGFGIDRVRRRIRSGDTAAAAEALEQSRDELTAVVTGLRKLMSELRPPALDESGLEGALSDYVATFRRDSGMHCSLVMSLGDERLPTDIETTIYRVSQEALVNIRRHSRARNVVLELARTEDSVNLRIRDDGRGFDVTQAAPLDGDTAHYGLIGMRERVEQRRGRWTMRSGIGAGTTIDAEFPIYQNEARPVLLEVSS
jgi:signal transduction histidine kinase